MTPVAIHEKTNRNLRILLVCSFILAAGLSIWVEIAHIPDSIAARSGINSIWLHAGLAAFFILLIGSVTLYFVTRIIGESHRLSLELTALEERLSVFPKYNPDPVVGLSLTGEITYINPAGKKLFPDLEKQGRSHPYLKGISTMVQPFPKDAPFAIPREISFAGRYYLQTIQFVPETKDIHVYAVDISHIKTAQTRSNQVNQLLQALRNINQLIAREPDPLRVMEAACSTMLEMRGFERCWIMQFDEQGRLKLGAQAGMGDNFEQMRDHLEKGLLPECTRQVLASSSQIVIEPGATHCKTCALGGALQRYDCIVTPLAYGDKIFGTFSAMVNKDITVDEEELGLIKEMARDVAFALTDIEQQARQKRAQERIEENERRYRSLFDNMINGYAYCKMLYDDGKPVDFVYLEVNNAFEKQTGLKGVQGKKVSEVIPGVAESDPELIARYGRVAATGISEHFETHVESLDMWFDISVYSPQIGYFVAVFEVITERKLHETGLRRAAEEWQTTFDSIPDMISIVDNKMRILRVNKRFADVLKTSPGQLIGKHCYDVVHGHNTVSPLCPHVRALATLKPQTLEYFEPTLGTYIEETNSPVFNDKGEPVGAVHVMKDITERRQLREQAELSSRLAVVGEMAAGIAHEINNPLTSVLGFSELLLNEDLPAGIKEEINIIAEGSKRVKEIVRRMLTFARQYVPMRSEVNVNDLILTTIELRRYIMDTANIKVETRLDPNLPRIITDAGQMQQVFLNIIVNSEYAMKKADHPGLFTVASKLIGDKIQISFEDNGTGITPANLAKLFNPFFTTKAPGEGTGLGLSMSRSIVLELGGTIEVESVFGRGTVSTIGLPVHNISANPAPEPGKVAGPAPTPERKPAHILVVDDEEHIRALISKILTSSGYTSETTGDPAQALVMLSKSKFDLLLMDMRMPGMNGKELYERIISLQPRLKDKIIFITGDTADIDTGAFLKTVGAPFITKPFNTSTLLIELKRLIN